MISGLSRSSMSSATPPPPLLGDGKGTYKILVVGNSGSGKSTLARRLSPLFRIPHVPLDTVWWQPGWMNPTFEEFQDILRKILAENEEQGWVIDGNYDKHSGGLVRAAATDIIWLDPPLVLYFPRLFVRSIRRLLGCEEPCSPGCTESWRELFMSSDSVLVWCLSMHGIVRESERERLKFMCVDNGTDGTKRKMRRLGGWGSEYTAWYRAVEELVRQV